MMQAILGNAAHPEYGVATIPFPIPRADYANCVALPEALEIGNARDRDCQVQEIRGPWPALKRLEGKPVNLDELDYLAKRLDSFSIGELAQFQALAENLDQFEFASGVRSPEEYGRYLIRDSGYFAYDPNLEDFYDYEKYGLQQIAQEKGCFTEQGYLTCQSEQSLEELLRILYVEPGRAPFVSRLAPGLEAAQRAVGGLIEPIYNGDGTCLVGNEEAKLLGMPGNRRMDDGSGTAYADNASLTLTEDTTGDSGFRCGVRRLPEPGQRNRRNGQDRRALHRHPDLPLCSGVRLWATTKPPSGFCWCCWFWRYW